MESPTTKKTPFLYQEDTDEINKKEEKKQNACRKTLLLFLIALLVVAACAIIAISVSVALSLPSDQLPTEPTSDGLMVTTTTQEELSGEYYGSNGAGIRFQVVINSTYYTLIVTSISTGMDIINVMHPQSTNMTMTSINSTMFMIMMNSTLQMNDYIVPPNATGVMETMMMSDSPHMTDDLLQELDSINVNITRQLTLQLLALSEEALLIIEAAKALVEMNNVNSSYPPVRQFYLLGLQLEKMRGHSLDGASTARKRSTTTKNIRCAAGGGYCPASRCPYSRFGNDCHGMCGYGCDCWRHACGDCCVNHYCETHDECCATKGVMMPMNADNMMSSVGRDTLLSMNPKYAVGIYRFYCPRCSVIVTVNKSSFCLHKDTAMSKRMLLIALLYLDAPKTHSHDKPCSEPTEETGIEEAMMIAEMLEEFSGDLYFGSKDAGFHFQIVVNSTYYILRITSIGTGMDIINIIHPQSTNMTMTSINNTMFMIVMNSTSQMNDYIVPPNATGVMETMMRSNDPQMTNALFQELDSNNLLASSQKGYLIIESAKTFYEKIRTSSSKRASPDHIKQFWLLGLELEKMRSQLYLLGGPNRASATFKHIKCAAGESYCPAGTKKKCYNDCYKDCSCEEK
uniref:Uncharacterized protein n=1 Tax=Amphimedon queenslandica TaxID=400682 RepID=A0A1X7T1Q3_AMPQE